MRFGQRCGESLQEQLIVESVRLPRSLRQQIRQFACREALSVSEAYRRIVAAGLEARRGPETEEAA